VAVSPEGNPCRQLAALLVHGVRRICKEIARASGEMPRRIFATQLLDELPQQLAPQSVPQTSDPAGFFDTPVEKSGLVSETGNERTAAPQLAIGTLLYLVSLGMVAAATAGAFFGVGFLLLAHPKEETVAGGGTRDFGAEVSPVALQSPPLPDNASSPPPETGLPDPTTAAAQPVSPPQGLSAREVLPSNTTIRDRAPSNVRPPPMRQRAPQTMLRPAKRSQR
jgi:hypothetical protein